MNVEYTKFFDNDKELEILTALLLSNTYKQQLFEFVTKVILGLPSYMTEKDLNDRMTVTKECIKNNIESQSNLSDSDKAENKALVDTLWPKAEEDLKIQLQIDGRMI